MVFGATFEFYESVSIILHKACLLSMKCNVVKKPFMSLNIINKKERIYEKAN